MRQPRNARLLQVERARAMRKDPTPAERTLWQALRGKQLGVRFKRQEPCGPFILDFACVAARLVIEVDGDQHAESAWDRERDAWLIERGWHIVRFSNHQVLTELENVLEAIASHVAHSPVAPT
jgi:very-short-patch-repair endonuclease